MIKNSPKFILKRNSKLLSMLFNLNIFIFLCYLSLIKADKSNEFNFTTESNYRFPSFASYSNGDMILSISSSSDNNKLRIFFGIRKNGRPFFQNGDSYLNYIEVEENKFESETFIIKLSNNEYLLNVGKESTNVEIFDFQSDNVYKRNLYNFLSYDYYNVYSLRNAVVPLYSNSNNYYLFGLTIKDNISNKKFIVEKHKFESLRKFGSQQKPQKSNLYSDSAYNEKTGISCYQAENQLIVCFCLTTKSYDIIIYDSNLDEKKIYSNNLIEVSNAIPFYKCIHLKGNIGIFSYYQKDIESKYYPILYFSEYEYSYDINENRILNITFSYKEFDTYLLSNDLIKIEENKVCFSSSSKEKNQIYIILLNLLENYNYIIRYYSLPIYEYNYKLHLDIRTHAYNNFVALAFSYCELSAECLSDGLDHSTTFMILSYPNSTDYNFFLLDYFLETNSKIFNINLENHVMIENNIFGYVLSHIIIQELNNCEYLQLTSSFTGKIINNNYKLKKSEIINLSLSNFYYYLAFICNIQFIYAVTESDLKVSYNYTEYFVEQSKNKGYNKELYYGRLGYYNITLKEKLFTFCENKNCQLCLYNDSCIICKNNFTRITETKEKICLKEEEIIDSDNGEYKKDSDIEDEINKIEETNINYEQIDKSEENTDEVSENINENKSNIYLDEITQIESSNIKENDENSYLTEEKINKSENMEIDENLKENYTTNEINESNRNNYENNDISEIITNENLNEKEIITNIEEKTYRIDETNIVSNFNINENGQITNLIEDISDEISSIYTEISITEETTQKIYLESDLINLKESNQTQLIRDLQNIINSIDITKNYEMVNEKFTMNIRPTNLSDIPTSTHINFSNCENILRNYYNISESRILVFLQLELNNKNEKSLVNQVEYQVYDDNKTLLDLSICKDTNIKVFYSVKSNSSMDLSTLYSFKDLNIDIFNIKDKFFTDICTPYSNSENDIILMDRIIDFYQNYSLCDENCMYNEFDIELKIISCDCSVKNNLSVIEPKLKLAQLEDIEKTMAFFSNPTFNVLFL